MGMSRRAHAVGGGEIPTLEMHLSPPLMTASLLLRLSLLAVFLAGLAAPPASAQFIPDDPIWDEYPGDPLHSGQWNMRDIRMPLAWEISKGSQDVVIAIIDSKATFDHPDLVDGLWFNLGEDINQIRSVRRLCRERRRRH